MNSPAFHLFQVGLDVPVVPVDPGVLVPLPPRLLRLILESRVVLGDLEDQAHLVPPSVLETAGRTEHQTPLVCGSHRLCEELVPLTDSDIDVILIDDQPDANSAESLLTVSCTEAEVSV